MKRLFKKIKINRKYFILGLFILAVVIILLPQAANAEQSILGRTGSTIANSLKFATASPILLALGVVSVLVMMIVGAIDLMVISFLVNIVQYNNFINEPSIVQAWVIVRDLCNMFFILILLVVAFATILRIESYQWKKILPKLLIMAVLINFSRTICGLIIDASQIMMMTFTSTFGSGGNFVDMTQMAKYFTGVTFDRFTHEDWSVLNVVVGLMVGIMFLIISGIVLVVAMAVFFMRIVMLWIYIVLSPLAFLAAAFPSGQKYATQWWSEFIKYIINGPVLAFFIWMALMTSKINITFFTGEARQCFGDSEIMCMENFMPFILSIGMLVGGLMITQQIGGVGSSIMSKGMDWAKKAPLAMGAGGLMFGGWASRKFALFKGFEYGEADEKGVRKRRFAGFEIRPTKIYEGVKQALVDKKAREEGQVQAKAGSELRTGRLLGALGASHDFTEAAANGFMWHKGWLTRKGKEGEPKEYSVISSTIRSKKEREEVKVLEGKLQIAKEELDKNPNDAVKQKAFKDRAKELEDQKLRAKRIKAPYTFYADAKRREIMAEQAKKLGDNDNEHDLMEKLEDAKRQGNKELYAAILEHIAKIGHSNEALEMTESREDVKDKQGRVVIRKGAKLRADAIGMKAFVEQQLMASQDKGGLGLSEQEALAIVNSFSTNAKKVNHYNLSELVGVENGLLTLNDPTTQMKRAHNEMMKRDIEQLLRLLNRLGHGGEITYKDENGSEKRMADFNLQSMLTFLKTSQSWDQEVVDRQRLNPNEVTNLYNTWKIQQEITGIDAKDKDGSQIKVEANKGLAEAIRNSAGDDGTWNSIITAVEEAGVGGQTYIDKTGISRSVQQLTIETLIYGKSKYEGETFAKLSQEIIEAQMVGDKELEKRKNAELDREKLLSKALDAKIEQLKKIVPGGWIKREKAAKKAEPEPD